MTIRLTVLPDTVSLFYFSLTANILNAEAQSRRGKISVTRQHNLNYLQKRLSSPNASIGDPCFKVWIPDDTFGNDSIF